MNEISDWMEGYKEGYNDAMDIAVEMLEHMIKGVKTLNKDTKGFIKLNENQS